MNYLLVLTFLVSIYSFSQTTTPNLLIKNISFEKELYGWDYGVLGNTKLDRPVAKFSTTNSTKHGLAAAKIDIKKSFARTGPHNIYLIQDRIKLKKKKKYRVTFFVQGAIPDDKIFVAVGSGSAKSGRRIMTETLSFKGDGRWHKLSYTFVAKQNETATKEVDFKNAAVYFGFNYRKGVYYIDNVKVERIK